MFDALFPSHWSTIRKLMWLKILKDKGLINGEKRLDSDHNGKDAEVDAEQQSDKE